MPGIGRLPETRARVRSRWFKTADSALRHVAEYLDGRLEPLNVLRRQIEQLKSLDKQRGYRREEPFRYRLEGIWHTIQLSYCSKEYRRQRWEAIAAHNRAQGYPEPELWHIRRHDHGTVWESRWIHGFCPTPVYEDLKVLRLLAEAAPRMRLVEWVPAMQGYFLQYSASDGWGQASDGAWGMGHSGAWDKNPERRTESPVWCD